MLDLQALGAALQPTRQGLDAAGFDLELAEREQTLELTVIARASACEDCLVPKAMFRQMASDEIHDAGLTAVPLTVVYPIDQRRRRTASG